MDKAVRFVVAIEQGVRGTRAVLFNRAGQALASAYEEHRQIEPHPGWVEQDAAEIWYKTKKVIAALLDINRTTPEEIAAVGITNQRDTTIIWDPETGEPYCNAIAGPDTRALELCLRLIADGLEESIRAKTGLPLTPNFAAPKFKWLLDNIEGLRARAEQGRALFGTVDSWLIWNLTGKHVIDCTNASRTLMLNLGTRAWDDELLEWFSIPRAMLPQVCPSSDALSFGYTRNRWPFNGEIPVCGGLAEQQAGLVGKACLARGEAYATYGNATGILLNTGRELRTSQHGLKSTLAFASDSDVLRYALEGSVANSGAAVQWLYNLGLIANAADSESVAGTVEDSGGVYFVPAFAGLDAPHPEAHARACLVGMTRETTRAHIVRAALEAICYQARDVMEAMKQDAGLEITTLKVDGRETRNNLLMQLQADILGIPVTRGVMTSSDALGAVYAAGLAVGYWENIEALRESTQVDRVFEPRWDNGRRVAGYRGWQRAIECAKFSARGEI